MGTWADRDVVDPVAVAKQVKAGKSSLGQDGMDALVVWGRRWVVVEVRVA